MEEVEHSGAEDSAAREPIKYYVLDTNVLLHDPQALFKFKENAVVVPIVVIEEIDRFKKEQSERGRSARQCSRHLDALRKSGSLATGVTINGGGKLIVDLCKDQVGVEGPVRRSNDNTILSAALALHREHPTVPVVFVSKDTNARIKADAIGLTTVDYDDVKVTVDELYTGNRELEVPGEKIDDRGVRMRATTGRRRSRCRPRAPAAEAPSFGRGPTSAARAGSEAARNSRPRLVATPPGRRCRPRAFV